MEEEVEAVAHAADGALVGEYDLVGARRGAREPADDQADDQGVDEDERDRAAIDEQQHAGTAIEEVTLVVRHRIPNRCQRLE